MCISVYVMYFLCVFKKAETAAGERQTLATGGGRFVNTCSCILLKRAPRGGPHLLRASRSSRVRLTWWGAWKSRLHDAGNLREAERFDSGERDCHAHLETLPCKICSQPVRMRKDQSGPCKEKCARVKTAVVNFSALNKPV